MPAEAPDDLPHFANGSTPEAPVKHRGLLVFGLLAFAVVGLILIRVTSRGAPYTMVAGGYFPGWFVAGVTGALLAAITIIVLRAFPMTRTTGVGLVYLNCAIIYAFLAWFFLFS